MQVDASPFVRYVAARQAATDARRAGSPRPWSDDPIIATKKFCCALRDDDRGSVEARALILALPAALRERAAISYRLYNRPETLGALIEAGVFEMKGIQAKIHGHEAVRAVFSAIEDRGEPVLSAAYKINVAGGLKNLDSIARMVHAGTRKVTDAEFSVRPHSAMYTCHGVRGATGAGAFVAYQTMQDLAWVQPDGFAYKDADEWAYPSTGAARGIARLLGVYVADSGDRDIKWKKDPSSPAWQLLERLTVMRKTADMSPLPAAAREIMQHLLQAAREAGVPKMNLFEVEHNLCELDKYERVRTGEGKGTTYTPRGVGGDARDDEGGDGPARRALAPKKAGGEAYAPPAAPAVAVGDDVDEFVA